MTRPMTFSVDIHRFPKRLMLLASISALFILVAACGDLDDTDDAATDDQATVEIGGSAVVANDGVPPLYELSEAEGEDGEVQAAAIIYGQQPVAHMDALMEGNLSLNGVCFGVSPEFDDSFVPVVWPSGYSVEIEEGKAALIDDAGDVVAREGEPIALGGGNAPDNEGQIAEIAPEDCASDGYWMSSPEIRRLAPEVEPEPAIDNDIIVYFPQWQDEDDSQAGSYAGRLILEEGCMYLHHERGGDQRLGIWPPNWDVQLDGEDVVLIDEEGNELARTGDILSVESQFGQFDVDEYAIPGQCASMHTLIFDVEVTGGPDDEMPEAHVQTEEEAREQDAQHYADAFDVDLDEAIWRMEMQSRLRDESVTLEREEVDRFGGLHWEHEPEFKLVVLMTDGDEDAVRAHFDDPELLEILEVRTVEYTQAELYETQDEITSLLTALGVRVSSGTNIQENRVEIYVSDAEIVENALESAGESLPKDVVIVEEEDAEALDEPDEG